MNTTTRQTMMSPAEVSRVKAMLEYRRLARSGTETEFIARYLDSVPGMYADKYGNRLLVCQGSRTLISCHTDSVHRMEGRQRVNVSPGGIVSLARREKTSNCLGADDAAGIYAALRMIEAGVKATFIFHRDEESGGNGSQWLARNYPSWLGSFDVCLALDRRGTQDVIISQQWRMCASDEFAAGLADQLGMGHRGAEGIFTDSANYTDLIPECSNLSIGYRNEHSRDETLDVTYLEAVIQRLIAVDWGALPVTRKPGDDGYTMPRWGSCTTGLSWRDRDLGVTTEFPDDELCSNCDQYIEPGEERYHYGEIVCSVCDDHLFEQDMSMHGLGGIV